MFWKRVSTCKGYSFRSCDQLFWSLPFRRYPEEWRLLNIYRRSVKPRSKHCWIRWFLIHFQFFIQLFTHFVYHYLIDNFIDEISQIPIEYIWFCVKIQTIRVLYEILPWHRFRQGENNSRFSVTDDFPFHRSLRISLG